MEPAAAQQEYLVVVADQAEQMVQAPAGQEQAVLVVHTAVAVVLEANLELRTERQPERPVLAVAAQSASSGAQDAHSHQLTQETFKE
jgi:hypothetical protein